LRFQLPGVKIRETQDIHEDILVNVGERNLFELDIDVYTIYSPNI